MKNDLFSKANQGIFLLSQWGKIFQPGATPLGMKKETKNQP